MQAQHNLEGAVRAVWPTNTGTANTIKLAVATLLLDAPDNNADITQVSQTLQQQLGVNSINQYLKAAPDRPHTSLLVLLRQDSAFTLFQSADSRGKPSFWEVQLDVAYVLDKAAVAGTWSPAGGASAHGLAVAGLTATTAAAQHSHANATDFMKRQKGQAALGAHNSNPPAQIGVLLLQQPRAGMVVDGNPPAASFSAQTSYHQHQHLQHPSGATHAQQTAARQQGQHMLGALGAQQPPPRMQEQPHPAAATGVQAQCRAADGPGVPLAAVHDDRHPLLPSNYAQLLRHQQPADEEERAEQGVEQLGGYKRGRQEAKVWGVGRQEEAAYETGPAAAKYRKFHGRWQPRPQRNKDAWPTDLRQPLADMSNGGRQQRRN